METGTAISEEYASNSNLQMLLGYRAQQQLPCCGCVMSKNNMEWNVIDRMLEISSVFKQPPSWSNADCEVCSCAAGAMLGHNALEQGRQICHVAKHCGVSVNPKYGLVVFVVKHDQTIFPIIPYACKECAV